VTVLCGRLKAACEACSQTVPGLNSAAELHADLSAQLKLSRFLSYVVCVYPALFIGGDINITRCTVSVRLLRPSIP